MFGSIKIVNYILDNGNIDPKCILKNVIPEHKLTDAIRLLIDRKLITWSDINLITFIEHDRVDTVKWIIENGVINQLHINEAHNFALFKGYPKCAKYLHSFSTSHWKPENIIFK